MKALDEADAMKANSRRHLYEFNTFISKKTYLSSFRENRPYEFSLLFTR